MRLLALRAQEPVREATLLYLHAMRSADYLLLSTQRILLDGESFIS